MTNLRLSIRNKSTATMRPIAEFPEEVAGKVAYHAGAICALAPGAQYRIETTGGRPLIVEPIPDAPLPADPVVPDRITQLERAINTALKQGHALAAIKEAAFTRYAITDAEWAAVNWDNV